MRPFESLLITLDADDTLSHHGKFLVEHASLKERLEYYEAHPFRLLFWVLLWKLGIHD